MFKGTLQSRASFICLNSIQLLDTTPSEPPGFCSLEEFTCTDGQSTEPGSACDSHPDCSDGSDEDPAACCKSIALHRTLCSRILQNLKRSIQQKARKLIIYMLLSPRIYNDVQAVTMLNK